MSKANYRIIILLLILILNTTCTDAQENTTEIDRILGRIKKNSQSIKTNGEFLDYIDSEVAAYETKYGKETIGYISLKELYWNEYYKICASISKPNPILIQKYCEGKRELLYLNQKVFGDTSIQYANVILDYITNYANYENVPFNDNKFNDLIKLAKKGISNFYKEILLNQENNEIYYDSYLSCFEITAWILENKNTGASISFLESYEPEASKIFIKKPYKQFLFYKYILDGYKRINSTKGDCMTIYNKADSLVEFLFQKDKVEQINFTIKYSIPIFSNLGLKSEIFQKLNDLNNDDVNKILENNIELLLRYNIEWYDYYDNSLNSPELGLNYLEKSEIIINENIMEKNSINPKISTYHRLADFYEFNKKNIKRSYYYRLKCLNIELKAKLLWGDYLIKEYSQIANFLLRQTDTSYANKALEYAKLALKEAENNYGINSSDYNWSSYILGKILFNKSKSKEDLKMILPLISALLKNPLYVPKLNASPFQKYADLLNEVNETDTADFLYEEIFRRNENKYYFSLVGSSLNIQEASLAELEGQSYQILTQIYKRKNKAVNSHLGFYLFRKDDLLQFQVKIFPALKFMSSKCVYNSYYYNVYEDYLILKSKYDSILNSSSSFSVDAKSLFSDLNFLQSIILKFYFESSRIYNKSNGDSLRKVVSDCIEKQTSKKMKKTENLKLTSPKLNLTERECLLDVIRFNPHDDKLGYDTKNPLYAFVIIDKNLGDKLEYTFIEEGSLLEKLVQSREDNTEKISAILAPLLKRLKNYKTVYINPDGIFNILNLYSLKDDNDEYLIKNKTIHYINTLDIGNTNKVHQNTSITLFGNPVFGSTNSTVMRSAGNAYNNFTNISSLPYTKVEVETTADILTKKNWKAVTFTELECSETKLKATTNSNILHIATHGYYIAENDTANLTYAMQQNPFLRSGIIMGKVNKNTQNKDDNILSAYEVMNLNLKNTSLVVLSACESAKGELKPGQGVYGLQRAFKIAGAENVLVSVKNVDDKATQLLMKYFYTNVAEGINYVDALRNAQLEMLKHPLFNAPRFWNGFILIEK